MRWNLCTIHIWYENPEWNMKYENRLLNLEQNFFPVLLSYSIITNQCFLNVWNIKEINVFRNMFKNKRKFKMYYFPSRRSSWNNRFVHVGNYIFIKIAKCALCILRQTSNILRKIIYTSTWKIGKVECCKNNAQDFNVNIYNSAVIPWACVLSIKFRLVTCRLMQSSPQWKFWKFLTTLTFRLVNHFSYSDLVL
jgi:hypothetical protein